MKPRRSNTFGLMADVNAQRDERTAAPPPQCEYCGHRYGMGFMERIDMTGIFDGDGEKITAMWACRECLHGDPPP